MTTVNPDPSQESRKRSLRELLFWLFLIPVVAGSLLCCGQLALVFQSGGKFVSPLSQWKADYQEWADNFKVPNVNAAALIEDVNKEAALQGTEQALLLGNGDMIPTGRIWREPTATLVVVAAIPSSTPQPITNTPAATLSATPAPSRTSTPRPSITSTPTRTSTRTYVWVAPTRTPTDEPAPEEPTLTVPPPTITFTPTEIIPPTITFTPTITPTFTFTPTPTPTFTITPTFTFTPTPTPTFTPTFTSTITATLAPLRPVAESGGASEKYDATSCLAYFGYKNDNPVAVTVPVDTSHQNQVEGAGIVSINGQTTVFEPGRQYGTFSVIWNVPGSITWWLQGKPVSANWCNP